MAIRIGTRGSKLARWQAQWVSRELTKHGHETEIIYLKTLGDVKSGPIGAVGAEGVFTREIQVALLNEQVDLAVHSLKDLPTEQVEGLSLSSIPKRERCGDALVAADVATVAELPEGAKIGTGSARRRAQLLAYRNDLDVVEIRGNVDTRLKKLHEEGFDAIILAEAGLRRLGLADHISQVIPKTVMLPAVGQGALGLETRENDLDTKTAIACLHHEETAQCVFAERALLRALRGGCQAPIGAWARVDDDELRLDAIVLDALGTETRTVSSSAAIGMGEALGQSAAAELVSDGADELLDAARRK